MRKRDESASFLTRNAALHHLLSNGETGHLGSVQRTDKQGHRMQEADQSSFQLSRVINFSDSVIALLNPYVALLVWVRGWVPANFVPVRRIVKWVPTNFVPVRRRKSSSKGDE